MAVTASPPPPARVADPDRSPGGSRARVISRADVLLVVGLVALALAVRWPNLLLVPQFPSIGGTILAALDLADGRAFPLYDQAPYLGGLMVYLLAAVFTLFGPSVETTLLVPWAVGALTVVPTYLLGRELGGRVAGLLAGALLATSGAHTVVTSHVPLSHSLTPLLAATTLWLLVRAVARGEPDAGAASTPAAGRSLALAGLAAGLSLQSHPTVAPLLFGAAGAVILRRPRWLRTRWPYLALGFVLLGYSSLLAHHLLSGFDVVDDVRGKQARYLDADVDPGEDADRGVYLNNLEQLGLSLARLTAGAIDERPTAADYLRDPRVPAYPVLALAALAVATLGRSGGARLASARPGSAVLLLALLPAIFLPPLLSGKYKPILDGRYLMPLLPVLFVGVGLAFSSLAAAIAPRRARLALAIPLVILAALLVLRPLELMADFYAESEDDGFSNALYLRTLDQLRAAQAADGRPAAPVLLDSRLRDVKSAGGGNAGKNFAWLLAVSRIPAETWQEGDTPPPPGRLAILQRSTADRLDDRLRLTPLDGRRPNGRDPQPYRPYRLPTP